MSPTVSPALDWPRPLKVGPVQLVAFGPREPPALDREPGPSKLEGRAGPAREP